MQKLTMTEILVLCLVITGLLGACSTMRNVVQLGDNADAVEARVNDQQLFDTITAATLTDEEEQVIYDALAFYERFTTTWDNKLLLDSAGLLAFHGDYSQLGAHYRAVEALIKAHWVEYSEDQQQRLLIDRQLVAEFAESIDAAVFANNAATKVREAAEMSRLLMRLALRLI